MKLRIPLALASAVVLALGLAVPAHAAEEPTIPPEPVVVETAMAPAGFDEEVAAANGFRIVTDANGVQSSTPVTAAAQQLVAQHSEGDGQVGTYGIGVIYGPCGYSSIVLQPQGLNYVYIGTSFVVNLPVAERWWGVVGFSGSGTFNASFNGGASGPSWSSNTTRQRAGGGWGQVAIGSNVIKVDGQICWSGSPSTTF